MAAASLQATCSGSWSSVLCASHMQSDPFLGKRIRLGTVNFGKNFVLSIMSREAMHHGAKQDHQCEDTLKQAWHPEFRPGPCHCESCCRVL